MSIHNGDEVWAGADMKQHELGYGSGNTVDDEGRDIQWGFWLGSELNTEEAHAMVSKLLSELLSHGGVS